MPRRRGQREPVTFTQAGNDAWASIGGQDPVKRASWLLTFAARDLAELRPSATRQLCRQLTAYIDSTLPRDRGLDTLVALDVVRECQEWLRQGIEALRTSKAWAFRVTLPSRYTLRLEPPVFAVQAGISTGFLPFQQVFAMDSGWVFAERLRFCPECNRPFIRRKGKLYCLDSCADRARYRRFLREHPTYRRERYEKQARDRTGPHVVVRRRRANLAG